MPDALNEAREAQPYADLRERLLRISDNICDAIAEHREPVVTLADANELDRAATLFDRCIALEGENEKFRETLSLIADGWKFDSPEERLQTVRGRARATLSGTSK